MPCYNSGGQKRAKRNTKRINTWDYKSYDFCGIVFMDN